MWQLVESCLQMFEHCSRHPDETVKTKLKDLCLEPVCSVAELSDPVLSYKCIPLASDLGRRLTVSDEVLEIWLTWLENDNVFYVSNYERHMFHLPKPSKRRGSLGGLFWVLHLVSVREEVKCTLCRSLRQHGILIQEAITSKKTFDREKTRGLCQDLATHGCNRNCDTEWIQRMLRDT